VYWLCAEHCTLDPEDEVIVEALKKGGAA